MNESQRENDERYRLLFANSLDAVLLLDEGGGILEANPAACKMFGRTEGELKEAGRSGILDANDDGLSAAIGLARQTGRFRGELRFVRGDGTHFPASVAAAGFVDHAGRVRISTIIRDISELVGVDAAIEATTKRYQGLVDSALVGVFQTTLAGDYLFANDAFVRMVGCTNLEELKIGRAGRFYREIRDRARFVKLLRRNGEVREFEFNVVTRDGEPRTFVGSGALSGDIISGIVLDITDRKRSEGELRFARASLENLSHSLLAAQENERRAVARELHDEIGQILTIAKIDLQDLRNGRPDGRLAERLDENIRILNQCLSQVRSLSFELRPPILDDLGLLAALRWQVDRYADRGGFSIRLDADELPARLDSDIESVCFRIVHEALTNVAGHAGAQHVDIKLRIRKTRLSLSVRDDGSGFDVERAAERAASGGALGILGMQERAALVNGRVDVSSKPGRGTIIMASIPVRFAKEA